VEKRVYSMPHAGSIKLCSYTKEQTPLVLPDRNSKDDIRYCPDANAIVIRLVDPYWSHSNKKQSASLGQSNCLMVIPIEQTHQVQVLEKMHKCSAKLIKIT
jgi:hypothetical protein